jgi:hypothetical protein
MLEMMLLLTPDFHRQGAQFYANCAHVRVINSGVDIGSPGPAVKIPGVYTFGQKGMLLFYQNGKGWLTNW